MLLELHSELQGFFSQSVGWIWPELVVPSLVIPDLIVPVLTLVPGLTAPRWVGPVGDVPHRKAFWRVHQTSLARRRDAGIFQRSRAQGNIINILWPVVFWTSFQFHSLILEPGLNLFVTKVQGDRKFLHLLEAEVFLLLESVMQYTELGPWEHSSALDFFLLEPLPPLLHPSLQWRAALLFWD